MFQILIDLCLIILVSCDVISVPQKPSTHLQAPRFKLSKNGYIYNPPSTTTKSPDQFPGYNYPPNNNPPFFDEVPSIPDYSYPSPTPDVYFYEPPTTSTTTKNPNYFDDPPINSYLPPQQDIPLAPSYGPPTVRNIPLSYLPPENIPITNQPPVNDIPEIPPTIQNDPTYLPPEIFHDDSPSNEYLPPDNDDDNDVISIDVPPQNDVPFNTYLPPNKARTNFRNAKSNRLQIRVYNMSCIKTQTRSYFKTVIHTSRPLQNNPVIENTPINCISATHTKTEYSIFMNGIDQMEKCGIRDCSTKNGRIELCMNIRLPTIAGLKLPEDILLTLQCRTQEKFASQVKYISMHSQEIQGRSVQSATVTGGKQSELNGNAILLRRSTGNGEFIIPVQKGSSVLLGEELLLKTHIRKNDGWRYSKINDVKMHQIELNDPKPKNTIEILNTEGCRNVHLQGIIPTEQNQDPNDPLISSLPLRAFAFQGMKSGQQMVLTVKMRGCMEVDDCESQCNSKKKHHHRRKRNSKMTNKTEDFETEFKFKVLMPIDGGPPQITYTYERHADPGRLINWIQTILYSILIILPIVAIFAISA